jgi:hypothetical protein
MRHLSRSIKRVSLHYGAAPLLCCLLVFACCSLAQAQSGRRVTKKSPSTPVPSADAGQTTTTAPPVAKAEKEQLKLYVCAGERDPFLNIPRYISDTIRNVFVQRVSQASSIDVTSGPEMHRTEAIKRAKGAEKEYVVLLELDSDEFDSRRSSNIGGADLSRLIIRYYVFTPGTGKSKLEGVVYQQQYRVGRGGVGIPTTRRNNPLYSDYLLKEAAKDAANRVLAALRPYSPPRDPGLTEK